MFDYSGNWWNTPNCYDSEHQNTTGITPTIGDGIEETGSIAEHVQHNNSKTPVEEYWE